MHENIYGIVLLTKPCAGRAVLLFGIALFGIRRAFNEACTSRWECESSMLSRPCGLLVLAFLGLLLGRTPILNIVLVHGCVTHKEIFVMPKSWK